MKPSIELNGVANIIMLSSEITENPESYNHISVANKINEQAKLLERYMIAYSRAMNDGTKPPFWHDITQDPKLYPTNRELNKA